MKPSAFISSLSTEHSCLRKTLFQDFGEAVWVAEHSAPELAGKVGKNDLEIVDTCTDFIEKANYFICIFAGRRGTRLRIGERLANATHFETELFHAALLGKQVHVFVANGFEPDPSLRGILEVLEASVDPNHWNQRLTDDQILSGIGRILNQRPALLGRHILRRLVARLFEVRRGEVRKGTPLTEFFAGDSLVDERIAPDLDLVNAVMTSLDGELDQRKQLSRIYIALREVLMRPFDDTPFLVHRNRLLAEWGKAASWYGLHAHVRSGVLAAAQSMALVRERLRTVPSIDNEDEKLHYPGGELASALYSISKSLPRIQKAQALWEAKEHLEQSLAEPTRKQENLLAIRGSVFRQLGMLDEAVKDYELVLQLRERLGMGPLKIGEAMAELGFGYFRQRRIRKALDYLERGVGLMRKGGTSGFLLRGIRKLAVVRAANLRLMPAWRAWQEARRTARKTRMYDQL
jgi:tetratricopeptide (TPR) repeat protein